MCISKAKTARPIAILRQPHHARNIDEKACVLDLSVRREALVLQDLGRRVGAGRAFNGRTELTLRIRW